MKRFVVCLFLLIPFTASAQTPPPNGMDMGKLMQLVQEMQLCMAKIDPAEMAAFEEESSKVSDELEALCDQGKRDKAQKKALAYGKKVMKSSAIMQMQKCSEITKGLMPEAGPQESIEESFDFSTVHVCDK